MTASTKAITMCLLMITATNLAGCASDDGEAAPVTHVPPIDVRPFENQGVGIQFWNREWMPAEGDSTRAEFVESLDLLTEMNVNYVHIHFNVRISGEQPNGVFFDRGADITLTEVQFVDLMALLNERGFAVNLKVGFWHPGPGWGGMMEYQPSDVDSWFDNWGQELIYWGALAEQTGVDALDVAYEMSKLTTDPAYTEEWGALIDGVEAVYSGMITANFQNPVEAQQAVFLDRLDMVMTSVFYKHVPTGQDDPTVAELVASWTDASTDADSVIDMNMHGEWGIDDSIVNEIKEIHTVSGKPVMIGDIAFISLDGAASNWNGNFGIESNPADPGEQADQYEAFFQIASRELDPSWFKGVTFLTWFPFDSTNHTGPYEEWEWEFGPQGRSFRGKPAQQIIVDWFGGAESNWG